MWYKLPFEKRAELMRTYKKGGFSYNDMVKDYNSTYEKYQQGGEQPPAGMTGMMKAKIATEAHYGNPAAQRMVSPYPKTGNTPKGIGTHYMSSMGEYAVPLLQDKGADSLQYMGNNPPPSSEDIKFNTEEDAQYFSNHYKEVAPMMRTYPPYSQGGLVKYGNGGNKSPYAPIDYQEKLPGMPGGQNFNDYKNNLPTPIIDKLASLSMKDQDKYYNLNQDRNQIIPSTTSINLTQGRYNTGKLNTAIVDSILESSNRMKVDPYKLLSLAGRETTLNTDKRSMNDFLNKKDLISGWNLDEKNEPTMYVKFLADRKVPGVQTDKLKTGMRYLLTGDNYDLENYLISNPKIVNKYINQSNTYNPKTNDYFDLANKRIKEKGFKGYNSGDLDYENKIANEEKLLRTEPELSKYIKNYKYKSNKQ